MAISFHMQVILYCITTIARCNKWSGMHGLSVCLCICLLVTFVTETAEPIKMPFMWVTRMDPRNHVLDGSPDPPRGKDNFGGCPPHLKTY